MSIKKSYLIELAEETKKTARILERIPNEKLSWKPHEKSMTLGELASHVVELHNWVSKAIPMDVFDFKLHYKPLKVRLVEELKEILSDGEILNRKAIEEIADEDWFKDWTMQSGDYVIAKLPRASALRFIVNSHLIHHRAQITVYLRLLDIPVPGLYGPSADDVV